MIETVDQQIPANKIYKDNAIWVGTCIGGPLVAGYLIAENFKAFGENDKAKRTWVYTIIASVIIFGGISLIPDNINIPNSIIPITYTAIVYYLVRYFQGQNISDHLNLGGQLFSWWRTITIGIIGLAITITSILGLVFLSDTTSDAGITVKTYGIMKHEIAFDENEISENEIDKIANGFIRTTFFDKAVTKYVYATKVSNNYELSISIADGIANDNQALQPFSDLRDDLQTFFPDKKITFKLVVDNLDNVVKTIE